MIIVLSPINTPDPQPLVMSRAGDTLTINGQDLDFSGVVNDAPYASAGDWDCPFLVERVWREGGILRLSVMYQIGSNPSYEQAFPEPLIVSHDGPIVIPWEAVPAPVDDGHMMLEDLRIEEGAPSA